MNRTLHVIFYNSNPAAICRQGMEFKKMTTYLTGGVSLVIHRFFN